MHFQMILVCFKPFDRGLGIHAPFIQYQEDLFLVDFAAGNQRGTEVAPV
ncbi:hypothetical protein [Acidovorax sp. SDU_ACID1]